MSIESKFRYYSFLFGGTSMTRKLRLFIMFIAVFSVFFSFDAKAVSSLDFINIVSQTFANKFSVLHFAGWWSNHVWWMFITNIRSLSSPQEIDVNGDIVVCSQQINGLYFNSLRGLRLWPLDNWIKSALPWYWWLTLTWGLFTTCLWTWSVDMTLFDVLWYIEYDKLNYWTSAIVAWWKYSLENDTFDWLYAPSLWFFDNDKILWFLFDSIWWLWFVWGMWTNECYEDLLFDLNPWTQDINTAFGLDWDRIIRISPNINCDWWDVWVWNLLWTKWNIDVKWNVQLTNATLSTERKSLVGSLWAEALLLNADFVNWSKLLATAQKNAAILCRWNETYTLSYVTNIDDWVLCIDNWVTPFIIDLSSDYNNLAWKVLVVKEWDVVLKWSMPYDARQFELVVEHWNVLIENISSANELTDFDWFGFAVNWWWLTQWIFINSNIIVNWIIAWVDNWWPYSSLVQYNHKIFIHGKLSLLNTPVVPSTQRLKQLENLFWNAWIVANKNLVNLQNVLWWRCNADWNGSDWFSLCNDSTDKHSFASLIVIDNVETTKLLY